MFGLDGYRLTDGNCIADLLVRAPAREIAGVLGQPEQAWPQSEAVADEQPDDVTCFAAQWSGNGWSAVEPLQALGFTLPGDHLEPLFAQGEAVLRGQVPALDPWLVYQNPVAVGAYVASRLGVEAIALWGSGEWPGAMGGAFIDGSGAVRLAISAYSLEEIAASRESRNNFMARLADESIERDEDAPTIDGNDRWNNAWRWIPGAGLERIPTGPRELLDDALKRAEATEQEEPLEGWGEWDGYDEVWVARS